MVGQCSNCGAWINGSKCEYCDTVFIDEESIRKEIAAIENEITMLNMKLVNQNALNNTICEINKLLDRPARPMF